ncbi:MAG: tetratricopeptide repeat protein, partial [Bacteroidales bacterium]|nr:tetratricopeptide repeat protein [Bacteroidales bacterium]
MKTLITSFFFLIISVCSYGQNMDSLYHLYLSSKGEKRIAVVNEISQAAFDLELNDSLYHLDHKAKPELAAAIVNEIMTVHAEYTLNDLNKAIAFALEAAQLYEQLDKVKEMDLNLSAAGVYYYRMGDYEKAIEIMLRCYELEKSLNNMTSLSTTLNNLGIAYSNWGYNKAAIEYFRKAIEIERPLNRPMQYAGRLSSLAKELALSGNYQEAIALIKEALVYDQKIEGMLREDRLGAHNIIMGDIYAEADSLKQAEQCYKYAVSIFEKINRQQLLASSLLGLGRLKLKMNRYTEAIEILKYCVEVSEKNQLLGIIQKANRLLYETYKRIGSSTLALAHLEQSIALDTLIFKETTQKQISEFQVKYETAEKQLEIERKQTEIDRYQTRQFIFIGGIIALGLLLTLLGVIVVQRTRRNRDLAEMNAIKDKFFRIISHDLHNPAIAQRDALQMLAENANQWDNKTLSDYYQQLNRSANHLVALVKNLLDWAKMQTEHEIYRPVSFSLVSALQPDIG